MNIYKKALYICTFVNTVCLTALFIGLRNIYGVSFKGALFAYIFCVIFGISTSVGVHCSNRLKTEGNQDESAGN